MGSSVSVAPLSESSSSSKYITQTSLKKKKINSNSNDDKDEITPIRSKRRHKPSPRKSLGSEIIARIRSISIDHISDRMSFKSIPSDELDEDGFSSDGIRRRTSKVKFSPSTKKNDWIAKKYRAYLAIVCSCFVNDPTFSSHHASQYKLELGLGGSVPNSPQLGVAGSPMPNPNRKSITLLPHQLSKTDDDHPFSYKPPRKTERIPLVKLRRSDSDATTTTNEDDEYSEEQKDHSYGVSREEDDGQGQGGQDGQKDDHCIEENIVGDEDDVVGGDNDNDNENENDIDGDEESGRKTQNENETEISTTHTKADENEEDSKEVKKKTKKEFKKERKQAKKEKKEKKKELKKEMDKQKRFDAYTERSRSSAGGSSCSDEDAPLTALSPAQSWEKHLHLMCDETEGDCSKKGNNKSNKNLKNTKNAKNDKGNPTDSKETKEQRGRDKERKENPSKSNRAVSQSTSPPPQSSKSISVSTSNSQNTTTKATPIFPVITTTPEQIMTLQLLHDLSRRYAKAMRRYDHQVCPVLSQGGCSQVCRKSHVGMIRQIKEFTELKFMEWQQGLARRVAARRINRIVEAFHARKVELENEKHYKYMIKNNKLVKIPI